LKQLESEGLVTRSTEQTPGRPQKSIYTITKAGVEELNAWLELPVRDHPIRSELLFKIFFSKDLPVQTVRDKLDRAAEMHRGMLKEFDAIETGLRAQHGGEKGLHLWLATLRYGQKFSQAMIEWCEEMLRTPELGGTGLESKED
jgi:predicted ArsR family transcriptional regulator